MKLKKMLIVVMISLLGCTATRIPESTCRQFKKGNFISHDYNNSGLGHWREMTFLIERTDSTETIISKVNILPSETTYYKIKWIDPCNYEQTYISGANDWIDSLIRNKMLPKTSKYTIIKGTSNYYIQSRDKRKDTIWLHQDAQRK